jgi:transcription antitermination factor NusG
MGEEMGGMSTGTGGLVMAAISGVEPIGAGTDAGVLKGFRRDAQMVDFHSDQAPAQWYVVYTSANHERRVAQQFELRGIEHFLPQYESVRKWKDRKVRLSLPLFPGYVFVNMALRNRLAVLQVPGVASLVGFNGQPAAIPAEDLLRIRDFLARGFAAEPHPVLRAGERVRVIRGPLAGMEGIFVRKKNRARLIISFETIERAIAVEIGEASVEPLA